MTGLESIDVQGLQHAILTCVTAGPGLGFNRAALFLSDEGQTTLGSAMAIGPATADEAHETWTQLAQQPKSLRELLSQTPEGSARGGFQRQLNGLTIRLEDRRAAKRNPLLRAYWQGQVSRITDPCALAALPPELRAVFSGTDVVCVPLVVKNRSLGLIIADNAFSHAPIGDAQVQLLQVLALLAALALDGARVYRDTEQQTSRLTEALEKLHATQDQLLHSERLATVGAVVARVSHEIRNPLTTIGGFARSLGSHSEDSERVRRNAGIIVQEVEKLEVLLKEMLDFTSPRPPTFSQADPNRLIASLAAIHDEDVVPGQIDVRLRLRHDLPSMIADVDQFQRVLLNLWQNAIQAMETLEDERPRVLTISTDHQDEHILIAVADTGPGIPVNVMSNIFTPFFTTKRRGTGLGLAVVKKIVDDHHGMVRVESEPGSGTTFTLLFPIARES